MENKIRILWVDDEISVLKPHILFLEQKGYSLETATNGRDAVEMVKKENFDVVFLDENMPGLGGLETLELIKKSNPGLPIIMITKSEEESIMEEAIGSKITDYLIKPVNPNQILLAVKKLFDDKKLVQAKTTSSYQKEFSRLGMEISPNLSFDEWKEIYKKLIFWEMQLNATDDEGLKQMIAMQKEEANSVFAKYYARNYIQWLGPSVNDTPVFSHNVLKNKLFPLLSGSENVLFLLIDNLRFDQWLAIKPIVERYYKITDEDMYFSILPTATQYARNSLFAGLMPSSIQKLYPQYWSDDDDENSKNQFESELLQENLKRNGKNVKFNYSKILNLRAARKYVDQLNNLAGNKLNILVYNFVDMLSHAKTEMEIIKELASDEAAYRSLTLSWFEHSPLIEVLEWAASKKMAIFFTTDHGSIRVKNPVRIVGDKEVNSNIRFKYGKNLSFNEKELVYFKNPADIHLPRPNISTNYVFCKGNDYLIYPNNYNYYVAYFSDTFQHGGISLEEVVVPVVSMMPK